MANKPEKEDLIYLAPEEKGRVKMPPPYVSIFFVILAIILGFYTVFIRNPEAEWEALVKQEQERTIRPMYQGMEKKKEAEDRNKNSPSLRAR